MIPLKHQLAARLTFFFLLAGVGGGGAFVAGWVMPVLWCLARTGGLRSLVAEHAVFPAAPKFMGSGTHANMFMFVDVLVSCVGFAVSAKRGLRYWRRLVVTKGWLTDEQAKYFLERDEGF
jgi:hypothetical protein